MIFSLKNARQVSGSVLNRNTLRTGTEPGDVNVTTCNEQSWPMWRDNVIIVIEKKEMKSIWSEVAQFYEVQNHTTPYVPQWSALTCKCNRLSCGRPGYRSNPTTCCVLCIHFSEFQRLRKRSRVHSWIVNVSIERTENPVHTKSKMHMVKYYSLTDTLSFFNQFASFRCHFTAYNL